jgi:hypothetical protein
VRKIPFLCFFAGSEEKNFQFFSSLPAKKHEVIPHEVGGAGAV